MLYLSDPLYVSRNFSSLGEGNYTSYEVYIKPSGEDIVNQSFLAEELVYRGHIYITGGYQRIYLNDIIASYMDDYRLFEPNQTLNQYDGNIEQEVYTSNISPYVFMVDVRVHYPSLNTNDNLFQVLRYYKDANQPRGENIPDISRVDQGEERIYNILNQRTNILPRIPRVNSQRFWLGAVLIPNSTLLYISDYGDRASIRIVGIQNGMDIETQTELNEFIINCDTNLIGVNISGDDLDSILNYYYTADEIGAAGIPIIDSELLCYTPIAKVDQCPSKYYLIWMDRTGAYQCQPFTKKTTITEDINSVNVMNLRGDIRPARKEVKTIFNINSDWLNKEEYKAFESIFTSPYLYLYDTELDEGYWVNCTQKKWDEKSHLNKPYNLSLTLETNNTQNILY